MCRTFDRPDIDITLESKMLRGTIVALLIGMVSKSRPSPMEEAKGGLDGDMDMGMDMDMLLFYLKWAARSGPFPTQPHILAKGRWVCVFLLSYSTHTRFVIL